MLSTFYHQIESQAVGSFVSGARLICLAKTGVQKLYLTPYPNLLRTTPDFHSHDILGHHQCRWNVAISPQKTAKAEALVLNHQRCAFAKDYHHLTTFVHKE